MKTSVSLPAALQVAAGALAFAGRPEQGACRLGLAVQQAAGVVASAAVYSLVAPPAGAC
ncbi:MAG TPA: hypothetical protein VD902_20085 [Symbiobacteriaceae bacterium]|nr:hypothetical protein [Symbiobacteriaceae bacterium]